MKNRLKDRDRKASKKEKNLDLVAKLKENMTIQKHLTTGYFPHPYKRRSERNSQKRISIPQYRRNLEKDT